MLCDIVEPGSKIKWHLHPNMHIYDETYNLGGEHNSEENGMSLV